MSTQALASTYQTAQYHNPTGQNITLQCVTGAFFPEIKRPGLEADQFHLTSLQVKNTPLSLMPAWRI